MTTRLSASRRRAHTRARSTHQLGALSLALALSACAGGHETADSEPEEAEQDFATLASVADGGAGLCKPESFYTLETFYQWSMADNATLPAQNGALIRCQQIGEDTNYKKYRVLYKTSTRVTTGGVASELPLVASGLINVPILSTTEKSKYQASMSQPVLANTHGATGVIKECGPSRKKQFDSLPALQDLKTAIGENPVLTAPDYVGLGVDHQYRVPDADRKTVFGAYAFNRVTHPFVSIESEGRATIDLVRATKEMPDTFTGNGSKWLVTGQSQGGHAALASAEVYSRGYGTPGPILKGAIAGAPASELDNWNMWIPEAEKSVMAMVTAGTTLEYRDLRASVLLNEPAITNFAGTTNKSCFDNPQALLQWGIGYAVSPFPSIFQPGLSPFQNPTTIAILQKNSPGRQVLSVPVFIGTIVGDPLISSERTDILVDRARATSPFKVTYCRYDAVVGGSTSIERAYNHDANRRIFPQKKADGTLVDAYQKPACYASNYQGSVKATGSDQTPDTGFEITAVTWAQQAFNAY